MMILSILVALVVVAVLYALSRRRASKSPWGADTPAGRQLAKATTTFDVIVVGGSIAGPVTALRFAQQGRKVAWIERDFERPDRIVGELMQPGGLDCLEEMGIRAAAESVGCVENGYAVQYNGKWVLLPYEPGKKGTSFHFGDFVMNLRKEAQKNINVTCFEGAATELLIEGNHAYGVGYRTKSAEMGATVKNVYGRLVVMCDGGGSKFRVHSYINSRKPESQFIGIIVRGASLPHEGHGHVILGKKGPILSYRLDPNEVRFLISYHGEKMPSAPKLKAFLEDDVLPELPENMKAAYLKEINTEGAVRSAVVHRVNPGFPKVRGLVAVGDHVNQRHPLTGGGMTVALRDVQRLTEYLKDVKSFADEASVHRAIIRFTRDRYRTSAVVNILSFALYEVFRGPMAMRNACFSYFLQGGDCVRIPMLMLSALENRVVTLLYHYVHTMLHGASVCIWPNGKPASAATSVTQFLLFLVNPLRVMEAVFLLVHAIKVFVPLLYGEMVSPWHYVDPTVW